MIRATVARGLRLLASLVAGDDPVADALAEVVRARRDAARALEVATRADGDAAAAEEMATRTREVVRAGLLAAGVGALARGGGLGDE